MKTDTRVILSFLQASVKSLEWTTSDGRTLQILGSYSDRLGPYWERFFSSTEDPCRRPLTWAEAQAAFDAASEPFLLFQKEVKEAEQLTREQLLNRVEEMFPELERRQ